ncbi:MAG: hypothetical protein JNM32_11780 [Dechloromonas sp.]|nr:hypothetical protein [Dechloromonas sp.]
MVITEARELHRDVTATLTEFVRALAAAFPGALEQEGNRYRVHDATAAMELQISPGPNRNIASLSLPTLAVIIRFTAGEAPACAALLAHLDRYLHRGGG